MVAGFYIKLNVWGSLGLNLEYDGGSIIEIRGPIFLYNLQFWKVVPPSVKAQCNCVVPRSVILRAMFGPLPINLGGGGWALEFFEGHILPSVKHNPIRFFYKS